MLSTPVPSAEPEAYGLTTAQIIYHVPDHFELLQDFVWQEYDFFPQFPSLRKFLAFWEEEIEGPLHSITVAHARLIYPMELRGLRGARLN
ncbi:MAG: aspartate-semialdehyde dehydrogenase [Devosia sp.]|uniref:protein usg n=1 Tax=Devosia sp. TaxID=1871048 RepID=UPI00262609F6|nr:protein usg [Devosia sp.]MDB5541547.1 aspartate-semialdehyde dehydrogenase [Devosia sp.]